jgi:hypothetical protein
MASTTEIVVAAGATVASWAAVAVSLYTLRKAERDAKRRTAFERIAALEDRVRSLSAFAARAGRDELLTSADGRTAVGDAGRAYQAVLNAFELLAFAVDTGVADRGICDKYLRRMGQRARGVRDFIYSYRKACGDDSTYNILEPYLRGLTLPPAGEE